jgi:hypothetical protein
MSSFVVSDTTINRIVSAIQQSEHATTFAYTLVSAGLPGATCLGWSSYIDRPEHLGAAMRAMNVEAVRQRYGDDELVPTAAYRYESESATPVQALKSLHCLLYQSNEGDVHETPLYRWLREVVDRTWMMDLIDTIPAYQRAEWG